MLFADTGITVIPSLTYPLSHWLREADGQSDLAAKAAGGDGGYKKGPSRKK